MSGWKHGESPMPIRTKEYNIWRIMRQRCNNPNSKGYKYYGARGIICCERWSSYNNFIADMGRCPDGWGIERQDVNGNYEPSNCSWQPLEIQSRNRRWVIEKQNSPTCERGHVWSENNEYINKQGYRICRSCNREHMRRYRAEGRSHGERTRHPEPASQGGDP